MKDIKSKTNNPENKPQVIIIGAGMAGLICAISLARAGLKVKVLESNDKVGKKLLMTGNGRCNLTNISMDKSHFHSDSKNIFDSIFSQFNFSNTLDLLSDLGLNLIELDEGKLYPMSLQASSVIKALLFECDHLGVDIEYRCKVIQLSCSHEFEIECKLTSKEDQKQISNRLFRSKYVVIATGGKSYPDTGSTGDGYVFAKSFGHTLIKTYPSIVQVKTDSPYNKSLKGFKCECIGTLHNGKSKLRTEAGEVLWTDYGLSGPVILQLSTMIGAHIDVSDNLKISIDLLPTLSFIQLKEFLEKRFKRFSYLTVEEALNGFLHLRLILPILKSSNIEHNMSSSLVTDAQVKALTSTLKNFNQSVTDLYLWNQAQVTKGGVNCLEINETTLESKKRKGLYFAGEVMDMDGDCGGYNLQWAISSGYVAAKAIAKNEI